jgi:hypothetical protein
MKPEATLRYCDGIAAARTLIALEANATALQQWLPDGWNLAPCAGDDLPGKTFTGANVLLPFHEISPSGARERRRRPRHRCSGGHRSDRDRP